MSEELNPKAQLLEFQQEVLDFADDKVETEIISKTLQLVIWAPKRRGIGHKNFRNLKVTWIPEAGYRTALSADFRLLVNDGSKGVETHIAVPTRLVMENVWKNLNVLSIYVPSRYWTK